MIATSYSTAPVQAVRPIPQFVLFQARAAESLTVPTAITCGPGRVIYYVNTAFARFLKLPREGLQGLPIASLSAEPERMEMLLDRAGRDGRSTLAPRVSFITQEGKRRFGATLVQPLVGGDDSIALVQVVDEPSSIWTHVAAEGRAAELAQVNERLLLASLREHELAERAAAATREVERMLRRTSVLSGVNAILSTSLDLEQTLQLVARLPLPELADCCVVQLAADTGGGSFAVAHRDHGVQARLQDHGGELSRDADLTRLFELASRTLGPAVLPELSEHEGPKAMVEQSAILRREGGMRAGLAVPLLARGRTAGVLALFRSDPDCAFDTLDVEFALELGQRASVAINNAQLYQEAQQAIQLREDVLAIVSHDLRNPLGAISMSVERFMRGIPDDSSDVRQHVELMYRSTKRMRSLIEELLEVASIQTSQLVLRRDRVSLSKLIGETLEMFALPALEKNVSLVRPQVEHVAHDAFVTCDSERIMRVLANLVGNAVKFTPPGGQVEVTTERVGDEVQFMVRDTGPGVSSCERHKLFERYWKGQRTGRFGMGLGLYIARSIVDAHGGRIWVKSEPPHGSTFIFTIPADT